MIDIDKTEFWKERLEEVDKKNFPLLYSVFLSADITAINRLHESMIKENIKPESKVLDVGCGYGRISHLIPSHEYTGIDFSPEFILRAKSIYPDKKFIVGSYYDMPFKDKEFDWAISVGCKNMTLQNLGREKWLFAVKEMRRVAKNVLILEMQTENYYEII